MVHDILDDALEQFKQETDLFGGDEELARYFDIAVRNGFDTAGRRDPEQAVAALQEAVAALEPVEFPEPAPRTLRAVGLTMGMIVEHLEDLHANEEFMLLLKKGIRLSVQSVPEWESLGELFSDLLDEKQQ